jgi:predicted peroxiredoxin
MATVWTVACFLVPFNLLPPLTLSLSLFYFTYTMHVHDRKFCADVLNGAVPHCSASTLIGLSIRVKLIRSLPVSQLLKERYKEFWNNFILAGLSLCMCSVCVCVCLCVCVCVCGCLGVWHNLSGAVQNRRCNYSRRSYARGAGLSHTAHQTPLTNPHTLAHSIHILSLFISYFLSICLACTEQSVHFWTYAGAHTQVNKQLADKERVAAALENGSLIDVVHKCLQDGNRINGADTSTRAGG